MSETDELIDEVIVFFSGPDLLHRVASSDDHAFICEERNVGIHICSNAEYVTDIDARNANSFCEDLDERLFSTLDTWAYLFQEYCVDSALSYARERQNVISEMLGAHSDIRQLAEAVATSSDQLPFDEIHNHVAGRVGVICEQICVARAVTGGTRFGLTEALFKAFRLGLLPFGYDAKSGSIACIDGLND